MNIRTFNEYEIVAIANSLRDIIGDRMWCKYNNFKIQKNFINNNMWFINIYPINKPIKNTNMHRSTHIAFIMISDNPSINEQKNFWKDYTSAEHAIYSIKLEKFFEQLLETGDVNMEMMFHKIANVGIV